MKVVLCFLSALVLIQARFINVPTKYINLHTSRIINGSEAPAHSIPYQVAIWSTSGFCGGSLISNKTILTAAHCTHNATEFDIALGAHDITNEEEPGQIQRLITKKAEHKDYNRKTLVNDIALLFLDEEVELNAEIALVNLPPRALENNDFEGVPARVSGWGKTSDEGFANDVLMYTDTFIITNAQCKKTFGRFVQDTNICASGADQHSSCSGDSGGPLMTYDYGNLNYIQIGVVSYGSNTSCMHSLPQGYTRVTKYLDWIQEQAPEVIIN